MGTFVGGFGVILSLLGLFIAVLWILMPFAVFGVKDLAKSMIQEQKRTNKLLTDFIYVTEEANKKRNVTITDTVTQAIL